MKTKKIAFYLLAALLSGCLPSLHQLHTDDTLIFEERLVGKWKDEDNIWEFRKAGEKEYEMRVLDGEAKEGRFEAHLIELEGMMFLDVFPDTEALEDMQEYYLMHILPAHTFMRVAQIDPNLQLRMMNPGAVSDILKDDPTLLKHELVYDDIVLTAPTEQLQKFVVEYADVKDVFGDATEMTRLEPIYTDDDLVFDANLVGQWEGKDGEILDSVQLSERAYDLMFVDEDGDEHQLYANLARVNGITLMAIFTDKAELDPNDTHAYAFHLIPDAIFKVDRIEPDLILQHLEYEEVLEILGNDPSSQEAAEPDYFFEGIRTEL